MLDTFDGRLTFLDSRRDGEDRPSRTGDRAPRRQPAPAGAGAGSGAGGGMGQDFGDEVPFGPCWQ